MSYFRALLGGILKTTQVAEDINYIKNTRKIKYIKFTFH